MDVFHGKGFHLILFHSVFFPGSHKYVSSFIVMRATQLENVFKQYQPPDMALVNNRLQILHLFAGRLGAKPSIDAGICWLLPNPLQNADREPTLSMNACLTVPHMHRGLTL